MATDKPTGGLTDLEKAHKALDTAGVARGAGGYSVRYRIGLLMEQRDEARKDEHDRAEVAMQRYIHQAGESARKDERERLYEAIWPLKGHGVTPDTVGTKDYNTGYMAGRKDAATIVKNFPEDVGG